MKYFPALLVCLFSHIAWVSAQKISLHYLQKEEIVIDTPQKKKVDYGCGRNQNYLYDTLHPEYFPSRYVRINVHVIQNGDGKNNFSGEEGRQWIRQMVADANQQLANNSKMNLPAGNNTPVYPVPYQYVLTGRPGHPEDDGIYFHRNDSLCYMNKKGTYLNNVFAPHQYDQYGLQKDTVINCIMMEHPPDSVKSPAYKASNDGVGNPNWIKLVGCYHLWKTPHQYPDGTFQYFQTWDAAGLLNHELGHSLGLSHTWNQDDGCDDTPKHAGCWNYGEPPCEVVSNNIMDYNAYKNSLSPCQISRITCNFYRAKAQRKFIVPDWCTYDDAKTIRIFSGDSVTWNRSMDLFGDLIIENNASLTIQCAVSLPPGGRIILKPKASLYLQSGSITCDCPEGEWDGILMYESKNSSPSVRMNTYSVVTRLKHPF